MYTERREASVCEVLSNDLVARDTFLLRLRVDGAIAAACAPGQFAHIEVPNEPQLLLRRPFSIYGADRDAGQVDFVYGIRGGGTAELSRVLPGTPINVLMPLGHGYTLTDRQRSVWLVGGGLGCAALGLAAQAYRGIDIRAFFGFRSADFVFVNRAMPARLDVLEICTDDGSAGHLGSVADVVEKRLQTEQPDVILACGPGSLYVRLTEICGTQLPVQISVEKRMGCGIGGCDVCVCSVRGQYRKSCTDGPVFDLMEVDEYVS